MNEYKFMLICLMIIYIYSGVLIMNTPLSPTRTTPIPTPTRTVDIDLPLIENNSNMENAGVSTEFSIVFYRRFFTLMYLSYAAILYTILQTNQRSNVELFEMLN